MSFFHNFNKSKFITPRRRSIISNKPTLQEISLIHPITMEKITHHYSHDSQEESHNNLEQGRRSGSPTIYEQEELNEFGEHLESREGSPVIEGNQEETFDDELSPGTSVRESRDTSPRRRGKADKPICKGLEFSKANKPILKKILIMRVMICLHP